MKTTTCALDPIPTKLLKQSLSLIIHLIHNIINTSLSSGIEQKASVNGRQFPPSSSPSADLSISIPLESTTLSRSSSAKNLGVTLDPALSYTQHITTLTRTCRFFLSNIRRIRPFLTNYSTQLLVQSLVLSRLDYCNSLLAGLPATTTRIEQKASVNGRQVLYIQAFVLVFLLGKFMRKVFFGQLRAAEMEHLIERSWYAVTETCLAFTVFRDDFSPRFVALFTLLLFLKCFHWLAEDRVDFMERSPNISWLFHFRVLSLMVLLGVLDFLFVSHACHSIITRGASVQLVFGFEYAILMTMVLTTFIKYTLHTVDLQSENPWDNKAVYMLYTELFTGFIKVLLYMAFMTIMIKVHTFPLFAIRPMYLAMRQFKKAVTDAIMSRRAIRNMNTLYPDATPEELQATDNVCIICREEMVTGAKRLPCNHIFHSRELLPPLLSVLTRSLPLSCLRSWFQRQQTCPTCRMDVLRASLPNQTPAPPPAQPPAPPPAANPPIAAPGNVPPGMMPPFPPAMFPFWGPFPAAAPPAGPPPAAPGPPEPPQTSTAATETLGAGAPGPSRATQPGSEAPPAAAIPGFPFSFPPPFPTAPWLGMPPPPPFGLPSPPVPPAGFSGLSEEELGELEREGRRGLEARLQCLHNIHTLLDAAMLQINQYLTVLATVRYHE
ncbi:SYVN1 ligase, partial [Amia calva]|nr:SYVN1 ligase [Amia calva]